MANFFHVALIETQNTCTRRCWFCKFGQARQDEATYKMAWETILKIIHNLAALRFSGRISWHGNNEPLMEPRLPEIIRLTRQHCSRAFLTLNTNGDLLTEELYRQLRHNGLDALGVSIYDDRTLERIKSMRADQNLVVLDMRHPHLNDLENRGGNIRNHALWFEKEKHLYARHSCARPFRMININPQGNVVLCCGDLYSDVVMGYLNDHRLEEIWNNPKFQRYRATLKTKGRQGLPLCRDCSHNGSASPVRYPISQRKAWRKMIRSATARLGIYV